MDGGVGRACRGARPTDNLASYFQASRDEEMVSNK